MTRFSGSLDANIILRYLLNDVPDQCKSATQLLKDASGQLAVADTALLEACFVMERAYSMSREHIRVALLGFMSLQQINCNRILFDRALMLFQSHSALSMEDCCLAVYAELNDAEPLYTFDKKLAKQSRAAQLVN
jgi:predicted nucleic-acid-binding protein